MTPTQMLANVREALEAARLVTNWLRTIEGDLEDLLEQGAADPQDLAAPSQDREDLETLLEHGRAHLTGASTPPPPPTLADLYPNPRKLRAEWPDGSSVTFGPFADDANAKRFRVLAKRYLDPQAAAESTWSLEPAAIGEECDVGPAALIELQN